MRIFARIQEGFVFEFITLTPEQNISEMFTPNLVWVDVTGVDGIAEGWVATEADGSWSFSPYVAPPLTPEQVLASQSAKLQGFTQLAAAQKVALTNRISTLNDAIELEEATPAEIAELPLRQDQLLNWKRYAVYLGRVTTQEGWPPEVDWPVQPAEGMDLTVSAVAPGSGQLQ